MNNLLIIIIFTLLFTGVISCALDINNPRASWTSPVCWALGLIGGVICGICGTLLK